MLNASRQSCVHVPDCEHIGIDSSLSQAAWQIAPALCPPAPEPDDEEELALDVEPVPPVPPSPLPPASTTTLPPQAKSNNESTPAKPSLKVNMGARLARTKKIGEIESPETPKLCSTMGKPLLLLETLLAQLLETTTPAAEAPKDSASALVCPSGTRLVSGVHYETVQRLCTKYKNGHCYSFVPGMLALESIETPIHTCMDELEWPNQEGKRPEVMMRFVEAEQKCADVGKRLCTEFEWEFACEGPETWPYPYGHTYDATACNTDKEFIPYNEKKLGDEEKRIRDIETHRVWQGETSGLRPRCQSPFGVKDLVGNVEEWVSTSRAEWPYRSSLKGGFWAKPWAHCRGTNDSHGPMFRYYEIGFRCCSDPKKASTVEATKQAP